MNSCFNGHAVSICVSDRSQGLTWRLHGTQEDVPETAALQMRLSVMAGLNAKLAGVTKSWQEMRVQWHEEDREEVALQLHTVTGRDFAPEEVEQLVQNGGTETIYRQALSTISGASVRLLDGTIALSETVKAVQNCTGGTSWSPSPLGWFAPGHEGWQGKAGETAFAVALPLGSQLAGRGCRSSWRAGK